MQAVFRFRGAEEIVISNQVGGVMVEIVDGHEPGYHGSTDMPGHRCTECSKEKCGVDPLPEQVRTIKTFSKSEARSLASAMMHAAAEV